MVGFTFGFLNKDGEIEHETEAVKVLSSELVPVQGKEVNVTLKSVFLMHEDKFTDAEGVVTVVCKVSNLTMH